MRSWFHALAIVSALMAGGGRAAAFHQPIPLASLGAKLDPGYHRPVDVDLAAADLATFEAQVIAGKIATLPTWTRSFEVAGQTYSRTLVGSAPEGAGRTVIPAVIVPVRITVSDYSVDGVHPVVFDGTKAVASMLGSPIFQA